jgi:prepilin-type N-terminal cleavage/methylation domain-containing protein
MNDHRRQRGPASPSRQGGFSLIELLIAAAVFTFVVAGVSQLFAAATNLQRRASGFQRIQENALFVMESIAREVRVSEVQGSSGCSDTLDIKHPDNGDVTYHWDSSSHVLQRKSSIRGNTFENITSADIDVTNLQFCVSHAGPDDHQARVTIPMKLSSISSNPAGKVSVSLQTTVVSRDLVEELTN